METINSDKLFDLALQASQANDTQKSIGLMKNAIDQSPQDARMWHMLGTLYADIGIYDKAVVNMEKALKIDENYNIARFHLGLLHLTSGNQDKAESTWLALNELGETHYLTLFKTGLLEIVNDEVTRGIQHIEEGITRNHLDDSLNKDMDTVIENARLSLAEDI